MQSTIKCFRIGCTNLPTKTATMTDPTYHIKTLDFCLPLLQDLRIWEYHSKWQSYQNVIHFHLRTLNKVYLQQDVTTPMTNWQTDLTKGIEDYVREFEDTDKYVEKINIMRRPRVKKEYDEALKKLAEAKEAVSGFVGAYDEESR